MLRSIFSAGWSSFSNMAKKKKGSIKPIIRNTAALLPMAPRVSRYVGAPTAAASEKHTSCRLVRLSATFVLTLAKSFGTGTKGKGNRLQSKKIFEIASGIRYNGYNKCMGVNAMTVSELLNERQMTKYRLAKLSGVSQTTINDICSGKAGIKNCTGETLYKLAAALGVTVEALLSEAMEERPAFEIFKSNICHFVKDMGDIDFLIDVIESDTIYGYLEKRWDREALYLLAMVDYLFRENGLPPYEGYEELRSLKLSKTVYPAGVLILSAALGSEAPKEQSLREAIPEFLRHNIVESEVRNVA
jgi:transcriptional regulator with XRE-family HTH domain